jgi:hypothetical protein
MGGAVPAKTSRKHGTVIRLEDIVQNHPLSHDDHIIREIYYILKPYYKLSRKRLVDGVRMQAAEFYLLAGPEIPLKLYPPNFVAGLTTAQLEDIAGEEPGIKRKRAELEKEIELVEEGMQMLR